MKSILKSVCCGHDSAESAPNEPNAESLPIPRSSVYGEAMEMLTGETTISQSNSN